MPPTVSIIIPTHNRNDLLRRALASIVAQTYPDWMCIVIDDASAESPEETVRSFNDDRISLIRHEQNKGASAARNTGIKHATTPYVAFLDSDDEWYPWKLESQMQHFKDNPSKLQRLGAVIGRYAVGVDDTVKPSGKTWGKAPPDDGWLTSFLFGGGGKNWDAFGEWSTMLVRRDHLLECGGFSEDLPASQWWDLSVRLARLCQFDTVDRDVAIRYQHAGPRVRTLQSRARAAERFLTKYDKGIPRRRWFRSKQWTTIGMFHLANGASGSARTAFLRSFLLRPHPKTVAYALISLDSRRAKSYVGSRLLHGNH